MKRDTKSGKKKRECMMRKNTQAENIIMSIKGNTVSLIQLTYNLSVFVKSSSKFNVGGTTNLQETKINKLKQLCRLFKSHSESYKANVFKGQAGDNNNKKNGDTKGQGTMKETVS